MANDVAAMNDDDRTKMIGEIVSRGLPARVPGLPEADQFEELDAQVTVDGEVQPVEAELLGWRAPRAGCGRARPVALAADPDKTRNSIRPLYPVLMRICAILREILENFWGGILSVRTFGAALEVSSGDDRDARPGEEGGHLVRGQNLVHDLMSDQVSSAHLIRRTTERSSPSRLPFEGYVSRKLRSVRERLGCLSFLIALASI